MRPTPTPVLHFTHIRHLATIVEHGLVSDNHAQSRALLTVEVGNREIKERRRVRIVPVEPGGVVADYVPFYFAPRSPMMYVINRGGVATYGAGCESLVYLQSDVDLLSGADQPAVFTDRNAVLAYAEFAVDPDGLKLPIDWALMKASMWNNTEDEPDRMERRMAECLVHQRVVWSLITGVSTQNEERAAEVRRILTAAGDRTPVTVRPNWYF